MLSDHPELMGLSDSELMAMENFYALNEQCHSDGSDCNSTHVELGSVCDSSQKPLHFSKWAPKFVKSNPNAQSAFNNSINVGQPNNDNNAKNDLARQKAFRSKLSAQDNVKMFLRLQALQRDRSGGNENLNTEFCPDDYSIYSPVPLGDPSDRNGTPMPQQNSYKDCFKFSQVRPELLEPQSDQGQTSPPDPRIRYFMDIQLDCEESPRSNRSMSLSCPLPINNLSRESVDLNAQERRWSPRAFNHRGIFRTMDDPSVRHLPDPPIVDMQYSHSDPRCQLPNIIETPLRSYNMVKTPSPKPVIQPEPIYEPVVEHKPQVTPSSPLSLTTPSLRISELTDNPRGESLGSLLFLLLMVATFVIVLSQAFPEKWNQFDDLLHWDNWADTFGSATDTIEDSGSHSRKKVPPWKLTSTGICAIVIGVFSFTLMILLAFFGRRDAIASSIHLRPEAERHHKLSRLRRFHRDSLFIPAECRNSESVYPAKARASLNSICEEAQSDDRSISDFRSFGELVPSIPSSKQRYQS
eukprot:931654_1